MKRYDIKYQTPGGKFGVHRGLFAESEDHAKELSQFKISRNSGYLPEDFKVINVKLTDMLTVDGE